MGDMYQIYRVVLWQYSFYPYHIDMKLSPTLMSLVAAGILFVLAPYLPSWILNITVGTNVGSLLLLVLVLGVLQGDIVLGLATFLAVAALFLEHRRRTVTHVTTLMTAEKTPFQVEELANNAPDLVPGEVHPQYKDSDIDEYGFEPTEESGKIHLIVWTSHKMINNPWKRFHRNQGRSANFYKTRGLRVSKST